MITPHGGSLVDQILKGEARKKALFEAKKFKKIVLDDEQIKEIKNIARGVFSPITGYMKRDDFESVVKNLRLKNGTIFPLPIFLGVDKRQAKDMALGKKITLIDESGREIALLSVEDTFEYDKSKIAKNIFKTTDQKHPGVKNLFMASDVFIGGKIFLLDNSKKPYYQYNLDPKETRVLFAKKGWQTIAGFQTRNVIHRGHEYLHRCVLEFMDGLFINPVIGIKKSGDFRDDLIIESYKKVISEYYPKRKVVFSILPYQMRYGGPREAVLHAIIRKNFGCTHFIVGRDHAGVGNFYGPYDAQKIFSEIGDIGIEMIKLDEAFYCKKCVSMATDNTCGHPESDRIRLSGTYIRKLVKEKKIIPAEIMRPQVSKLLRNSSAPFV